MVEKSQNFDKLPEDVNKYIFRKDFFSTMLSQNYQSYFKFWRELTQPNNGIHAKFLSELLSQIISMEQNKKLSHKAVRQLTVEHYLSSFFLLSLIFNSKQQFSNQKEQEFKDALKSRNIPTLQIIYNLFFQSTADSDDQHGLFYNLVGIICFLPDYAIQSKKELTYNEQCKSNITHFYKEVQAYLNELKKESSNWHNSLIPSECELNETGEFSYAYEYLH